MTIGCDMPHVPHALLTRVTAQTPSYCCDAPILGNWPAALSGHLLAYLNTANDRSVRRWAASIDAVAITSPVAVANVNTPADLEALSAYIR